ncbi:MAG TPA: asparagine synthase (glutamine-hydrolyzing) [Flavobacteriaceae bacterium]|nr:asparagine synthase (glutamine-hydrolyzing) [Flavobacteriaceae bacterium]
MCGIVGFNKKNTEILSKMIKSIHHRGPDDFGSFESENCSLGHVRLSIMDLSNLGHQPMIYKNLKMVYNGEVYNFREIREELIAADYSFLSDTDTEVIIKAYHYWGIQSIDKFIGMFAIAIYDEKSSDLVLIRDRVGVKPLFYYHKNNEFVFASELKPIMEYNNNIKINNKALNEYFKLGYVSSNLSIFENCYKLPAGHYAIYNTKKLTFKIKEYWSILPYFKLKKFQKTEKELIDELENILINAFKYRMVSDVPVGVFLSGGIDSSIVAAILQKHHGNIHTFTIGFNESKYDESPYAKEIADYLGTIHTEKILGAKEAKRILHDFVNIYDEPFADSSGIPTIMVSQVAKDANIKVVLSADGGDEIFCGYERYWEMNKRWTKVSSIPTPLRYLLKAIVSGLSKLVPNKSISYKLQILKDLLGYKDLHEMYTSSISFFKDTDLQELMQKKEVKPQSFPYNGNESSMEKMMLWDYHHYMVDDILTKVDRATMSVSIEGREPLLDHRIAEFMAQVPFKYKYKDGTSKYLLKKVLERYIPKEMTNRPKKGFSIPVLEWFKGDLKVLFEENFSENQINKHQLFNYRYIQSLYKDYEKNNNLNNTNKLWFILIFQLWHTKYMNK